MLEELYARSRVRGLTALLQERIRLREEVLDRDRKMLRALEERYKGA